MIARLSDCVNTNGEDGNGMNVRSYNWVIRWGHADADLVAWRYTVHPEFMEVLMTLGCHHQKRKNKYGVQHGCKCREKEGKMNSAVGRESLPFMMPNVSDARRIVLRGSCESRFEVSRGNSNMNIPINRKAMWSSNRNG